MIETRCTASFTGGSDGDNSGWNSVTEIYQTRPFMTERRIKLLSIRPRGFCFNDQCREKPGEYIFENDGKAYPSYDDFSLVSCPECTHALFWTKFYNKGK